MCIQTDTHTHTHTHTQTHTHTYTQIAYQNKNQLLQYNQTLKRHQ